MDEELKHKIFNNTDCISEQTMFDYIDKRLSPKECHLVEKHLLDCELCSDALEGLSMLKDRGRIKFVGEEINKKTFAEKKNEPKIILFNYRVITGIAAALVLLIGAVFYFQQFTNKDVAEKEIAVTKTETTPQFTPESKPVAKAMEQQTETKHEEIQKQEDKKANEKTEGFTQVTRDYKDVNIPVQGTTSGITKADKNAEMNYTTTIVTTKGAANIAQTGADRSGNGGEGKDGDNQIVLLEKDKTLEDKSKLKEETKEKLVNGLYTVPPAPPDEQRNDLKTEPKTTQQNLRQQEVALEKTGKKRKISASGGQTERAKANAPEKETKTMDAESVEIVAAPQTANNTQVAVTNTDSKSRIATAMTDSISVDGYFATAVSADTVAEYPGGTVALANFIQKNYNFNQSPYDDSHTIKTKIIVEFTVGTDGTITNPKIKMGINKQADDEALRVVSMMPKWIPKKSNGKNVSSVVTLPFQLEIK